MEKCYEKKSWPKLQTGSSSNSNLKYNNYHTMFEEYIFKNILSIPISVSATSFHTFIKYKSNDKGKA